MIVSDYLKPVLAAALDVAELTNALVVGPRRGRDAMAVVRSGRLTAAWDEAAARLTAVRSADGVSDSEWTAWQHIGVASSAYQAWLESRHPPSPNVDLSEADRLWSDLRMTDTSAPTIIHQSKPGISLRPVEIGLGTAAGTAQRPARLNEIAVHAQERFDAWAGRVAAAQAGERAQTTIWDDWRSGGGVDDPAFKQWLEQTRRIPFGTGGVIRRPVTVPDGADRLAAVRLNPFSASGGVFTALMLPPPDAADAVTHIDVQPRTGVAPAPAAGPVQSIPYDGSRSSFDRMLSFAMPDGARWVETRWRNAVGAGAGIAAQLTTRFTGNDNIGIEPVWMDRATTDTITDPSRERQLVLVAGFSFDAGLVAPTRIDVEIDEIRTGGAAWTATDLTFVYDQFSSTPQMFTGWWAPPQAVLDRRNQFRVRYSRGSTEYGTFTVDPPPDPFPTRVIIAA